MEDKLDSFQYVIMKRMTEHFIKFPLDVNDEEVKELIRKTISEMYAEKLNELMEKSQIFREFSKPLKIKYICDDENDWIQELTCDRIKSSEGIYVDKDPEISVNEAWMYRNLSDTSSNIRAITCKKIFFGIFHELRHYEQYLNMRYGEYNENTIRIAREWAIADSGFADKSFYMENHNNFFIENDANEFAREEYDRIMLRKASRDVSGASYFVRREVGSSDKLKEMDDMEKEVLDDLIVTQGKTDLLHMYPILQNEYNLDGTKKKKDDELER